MASNSWALDEQKFLSGELVKKLMGIAKKEKEAAVCKNIATPVRDWFLVEVGLATGLRVKEVADLTQGDVWLEAKPYRVLVRNGKGGKARIVQVAVSFKRSCREYFAWKQTRGEPVGADEPLFYSCRQGGHMSRRALQKSFKRSLKRAGIPLTYGIHSLRHTYGTHLYAASNHNLRFVQKQLGHSSLNTTQVYVGLIDKESEKALERLYA